MSTAAPIPMEGIAVNTADMVKSLESQGTIESFVA